jgi:hypothetical protein
MKVSLITVLVYCLSSCLLWAGEEEVWYDAAGKIVRVTQAEKPKKPFVPAWVQRESDRDAALRGGRWPSRLRRTDYYTSGWGYSGLGFHRYDGRGCHWNNDRTQHHRVGYGRWGVSGRYQRGGWSVRVGF